MAEDDAYDIIYVASIRLKTGRRIYAHQYGKKAFAIKIKRKPPQQLKLL